MTINVVEEKTNLVTKFVKTGIGDYRLWIKDPKKTYPTVGAFCPHVNKSAGECKDCSLVLEYEDD